MQIRIIELSNELTHVALSGRLDTAGVDLTETQFNAAVAPRRQNTIVDMSAVEFLSSMGIRMLLTMAKTLDRSGVKMVLVNPRPLVQSTLYHTGIEQLIPIAADLEDARVVLSGPGLDVRADAP